MTKLDAAIRDEICESPAIVQNIGGAFLVFLLNKVDPLSRPKEHGKTTEKMQPKCLLFNGHTYYELLGKENIIMAKYSEETLNNWRKPPSNSEADKLTNAERMVKDCINDDDTLKRMNIRIFGQGSYVNDTNVRLNSDIDINVQYADGFYYDLPAGTSPSDFGLNNPISYSAHAFKNDVQNALFNKFGNDVKRKNKCIVIEENSYRVGADVVPTWQYKRYSHDKTFVEGIYFCADSGEKVKNFPIQHIENGKLKNSQTQRRFKRLTRIFKRIQAKMVEDGKSINQNITSFLLECLVWNVPDRIFNDYETWTDRLKQSIGFLYNTTKEDKDCKDWGEVSDLLYLFHSGRKWSRADVNAYLLDLWIYLEY